MSAIQPLEHISPLAHDTMDKRCWHLWRFGGESERLKDGMNFRSRHVFQSTALISKIVTLSFFTVPETWTMWPPNGSARSGFVIT